MIEFSAKSSNSRLLNKSASSIGSAKSCARLSAKWLSDVVPPSTLVKLCQPALLVVPVWAVRAEVESCHHKAF